MEIWEEIICEGTSLEWVAVKMISKFSEHVRKYPGFDIERAATMFAQSDEATQKRMCYESMPSIAASARYRESTLEKYAREYFEKNTPKPPRGYTYQYVYNPDDEDEED